MLFGRRKPGFNDKEQAESLSGETENPGNMEADSGDKPELLEYLSSLPEAEEDPFAGIAAKEVAEAEVVEQTKAQQLADYIRLRTKAVKLTSRTDLRQEIEDLEELLAEILADADSRDIVSCTGNKDEYFYSTAFMSDNYAMIAVFVEEKDLPVTIGNMVRFNCKTYPAPTPVSYFQRSPYNATSAQVDRAIALLEGMEDYGDIQVLTNNIGEQYLYSTTHMTLKYARALANVDEYTD